MGLLLKFCQERQRSTAQRADPPTSVAAESGLANVRPQIVRVLAVPRATLGVALLATERLRCEQRAIDADIILRHPRGGEALLETPTHLGSVERDHARERRDRLIHGFDDGASDTVVDDLRYRAAAERQYRCTAGHGLDHGQAKGLRPIHGKQQRPRVAEELRLLMLVDLADELDTGAVEQRLDLRPEIGFVGAVDLGCDLKRNAERTRNCDGAVRALLR